jgi:nucleotide-binding universal stress UspA family protein
MYHTILVPLDGSPFAEQALPPALELARRAGAELQLVQVNVPLAPMYAEAWPGLENTVDPALKQRSRAYLDEVVRRLRAPAGDRATVTSALLEGTVVEALHGHALAAHADLVVMTTHGRGPLARSWLGSVADTLVRRLPVPVLLVRPEEGAPAPDRPPQCRHVLIPLDGSPLAEEVLGPALALGGLTNARYTLLRVIPPLILGMVTETYPPAGGYENLLLRLEALHRQDHQDAQAYLDRVAGDLRARGLDVATRVAVHEQPAVAILEEVKAHADGVVALATHGRGGLPRLFLGSVADKVVRGSTVLVLVYRPAPAPQARQAEDRLVHAAP